MSSAALSAAIRKDWHRVLRTLWNEATPVRTSSTGITVFTGDAWVITREVHEEGDQYRIWKTSRVGGEDIEIRFLPYVINQAWKSADVITATVPGYDNRAVMFRVDEDGETWQTRGGATFAADVLEDVKEVPL